MYGDFGDIIWFSLHSGKNKGLKGLFIARVPCCSSHWLSGKEEEKT
jgi:hypothetical protein